jgi:hypothetical protein
MKAGGLSRFARNRDALTAILKAMGMRLSIQLTHPTCDQST